MRQIDYLARAIPLLAAAELADAATAARAAHLDRRDYQRMIDTLRRAAAPYAEPEPVDLASTDDQRQQAADYLAGLGARIVTTH